MASVRCGVKTISNEWRRSRKHAVHHHKGFAASERWFECGSIQAETAYVRGPDLHLRNEFTYRLDAALEEEFRKLVDQWIEDTKIMSSIEDMVLHTSYQRIIGMGPAALPLLFSELERRPAQWFWALRAITGSDPVKAEQRGIVTEMVCAWLDWARAQGFDW